MNPATTRQEYRGRNARPEEDGIALFVVIIALLLVTAVAAGMIILSNSEITIDANYRDEQIALFAAKAGLEEARDRMLPGNANSIASSLPGSSQLPGSAGSTLYITASGVTPWTAGSKVNNTLIYDTEYINSELSAAGLSTSGTWYSNFARNTNYFGPSANPVPYQWVRINLKVDALAAPYSVDGVSTNKGKQVYYDLANLHECVIGTTANCVTTNTNLQPVYEITSFAVTPSGTQRMLQQEVVKDILNLNLPGALTVDGPSLASGVICASGSTCNSGGAYITGVSPPSTCPSGATVPAIATADPTSQSNISAGVTPNKGNIVGTGGTPSVANAQSSLSGLSTVSEVEALVSTIEGLAGSNSCNTPQNSQSCSSATLNLGTAGAPTITVVNNAGGSAFQLNSGTTGYGILVVTGTLDYVNVNSYEGVILMLGTGQFISSSSKDTTLTGALFIAQDRCAATGPGCASVGQLMAGPSLGTSPVFNYHHGSASSSDPSIQYNSCVISQVEALGASNYRVLSQRELAY